MNKKIAVLSGDGIGPEITEQAVLALKKIAEKFKHEFEFKEADIGYVAYEKHGHSLPKETIEICKNSDAVLLGAIGDPRAEKLPPQDQPERAALLPLRKIFELYANLRPAKVFPALVDASPLKKEIIGEGLDIITIRELTGGIYFGKKDVAEDNSWRSDELKYSRFEIERIARKAFEIARTRPRKKVTSIDKANVLYSSVLWREVVEEVHKDYSDIELEHYYVDNAAMQLIKNPHQFDVIVTSNLFGDILSDESSMITGSLGMLPSASLGEGSFGLYEPIHGSAPKYTGMDVANPIATILSAAMLLKYSFGLDKEAKAIEDAVEKTIEKYRTKDIFVEGTTLIGTKEMGKRITENI
ncbi:MAG: 3-isopropylmalate dehydrogenase [Candidatus Diapherotrites archaeon]